MPGLRTREPPRFTGSLHRLAHDRVYGGRGPGGLDTYAGSQAPVRVARTLPARFPIRAERGAVRCHHAVPRSSHVDRVASYRGRSGRGGRGAVARCDVAPAQEAWGCPGGRRREIQGAASRNPFRDQVRGNPDASWRDRGDGAQAGPGGDGAGGRSSQGQDSPALGLYLADDVARGVSSRRALPRYLEVCETLVSSDGKPPRLLEDAWGEVGRMRERISVFG